MPALSSEPQRPTPAGDRISLPRAEAEVIAPSEGGGRSRQRTALQRHCDFFDRDRDGTIWPADTYVGFRSLGFGLVFSALVTFFLHLNLSYRTCPTWRPDPRLRIRIERIHRGKHPCDSGVVTEAGGLDEDAFEEMWERYAEGGGLTLWGILRLLGGAIRRDGLWLHVLPHAGFEWFATYLMLWPEDGRMSKEEVRGACDGSLFYKVAAGRREKGI